jgi:hypothetical protein
MDPIDERKNLLTRRHFFSRTSTGLGAAALASCSLRICAPARDCPACRISRPRKRVIYLFQHGGPHNSTCSITSPGFKNCAAAICRNRCGWVSA